MTDNTTKHSPLPFGSFYRTTEEGYPQVVITAANGCPVAIVDNHAEYKETAALILRAVNSHAALVKALTAAIDRLDKLDSILLHDRKLTKECDIREVVQGRAALALAGDA